MYGIVGLDKENKKLEFKSLFNPLKPSGNYMYHLR
jgi:hypothetical protein